MTAEFANGWVKGLSKPDEQGRTVWVDFDFVRKMFYADCDEPTAAAAIDHLRPQAAYPWTLPCSLTEPPSVPCTYVVCAEDQVVKSRVVEANCSPHRRRHRRTAGQSFTAPFTTVSGG
jgi:hypothetical protein